MGETVSGANRVLNELEGDEAFKGSVVWVELFVLLTPVVIFIPILTAAATVFGTVLLSMPFSC